MNKERTERIAKIILTIMIFGFIMVQFIANVITIKGACSEEIKTANAATEEIVTITLRPQNVGYYEGEYSIEFQGGQITPLIFTYNLTTNEIQKGQATEYLEFNTTYRYVDDDPASTKDYSVTMLGRHGTSQGGTISGGYGQKTTKLVKDNNNNDLNGIKLSRVGVQFTADDQTKTGTGTLTFYFENNGEVSFAIEYPTKANAMFGSGSDLYYVNGALSQTAYNAGYTAGTKDKEAYGNAQFQSGKAEGIATANEYTFERLISAVFDVPVQTIYGMFNFEILGVNILNFVLAIASLMVVVAILKLVI